MAAELDTRTNGAASFVSLRQSAWHRQGTVVGDELSYEEALTLGGLDYPLHLRPLTTTSPILNADGVEHDSLEIPAPGSAIVRSDTNVTLGVVGDRYRIVSNRDATQVCRALVEAGLARIETAGALRGGRDAWMALRFVGDRIDAAGENGGDEVAFYGLVRTNHDGSASVGVATTPVRVVCANTLAMALRNGRTTLKKVRHSGKAGERTMEAAQELWSNVAQDAESMASAFAALRTTPVSLAQFTKAVLDRVAPIPTLAPNATKRAKGNYDSAMFTVTQDRELLCRLWEQGVGQRGAGTAWDAFNAVTEAIDHHDFAAPTRGAAKQNPLGEQLPGGSLQTLKTTVWSSLLALTA